MVLVPRDSSEGEARISVALEHGQTPRMHGRGGEAAASWYSFRGPAPVLTWLTEFKSGTQLVQLSSKSELALTTWAGDSAQLQSCVGSRKSGRNKWSLSSFFDFSLQTLTLSAC